MLQSIIIGIGGIVFLMVIWIAVQLWWGKTFADYVTDDDVMAGRTKCSNCGCTTVCENKDQQIPTEEIQ
jgi:hypothetical protein